MTYCIASCTSCWLARSNKRQNGGKKRVTPLAALQYCS
jgi:hypothetical protein